MPNKLWIIKDKKDKISQAERRYKRALEDKGLRPSTIRSYTFHLHRYLQFVNTDRPLEEDLERFRENLFDKRVSKSYHNNYKSAIQLYHEMMGETVKMPFMSRNETIPYFFSEEEINRFFGAIRNLKHLVMYQVLYSACLRASEFCNLDDCDMDLQTRTVYVREGKGGRDGITFITEDVAESLRHYLSIRPPLIIGGRRPLFYTDRMKRWTIGGLLKVFKDYKKKAGIESKGGLHVFARHSAATHMTAKGVPLNIVQVILRHKDLRSTIRYAHVDTTVARQWYDRTMKLED